MNSENIYFFIVGTLGALVMIYLLYKVLRDSYKTGDDYLLTGVLIMGLAWFILIAVISVTEEIRYVTGN